MAHYMRTEYSDILDGKFIDRLEKNILFWGFFNSRIKNRGLVSRKYKNLQAGKNIISGKIPLSLLNGFLYGKDVVACIGYLLKNRAGVIDFLRNYGEGVLYQRRHRSPLP
jgi:hypothetical protein